MLGGLFVGAGGQFMSQGGQKRVKNTWYIIYFFLINTYNLKVMANFTELNDRNPSITLGSC
jgi:hypothetical protein